MDAVAKTWVDRSAYLESLQQGRTGGVLPQNPTFTQESLKTENLIRSNSSKPLMDLMWSFLKDDNRGAKLATEQYAKGLIR